MSPKTSEKNPVSEHLSLYRKYRPKAFDEVIGQEPVVQALKGTLDRGTIAHAYLFYGSRGTGKTSVARIFAEALGTTANDLYEIDAASNNSVDQIRELNESVNTVPMQSRYKVYILDEVHMLSKAAFNAFLKTLEEPPRYAIFILATTELEKVPETVISRCQVFTFKKPNQQVLRKVVEQTAKKEGRAISPDAAELIALLGDGSFRDAHGVLQKVLGATGDAGGNTSGKNGASKITREDVEQVTNAPRGQLVNSLVSALAEHDIDSALKSVHTASQSNLDISLFLALLIQKIRAVLLIKYSPSAETFLREDFSEEDFAFLKKVAGEKGDDKIGKSKTITSQTLAELLSASSAVSRSAIPQAPLELALIGLIGQNGGAEGEDRNRK
ncbi:MAG: DNA polymerase III subunit gamma/tau [Candidatus Pacebacteria bacterium]|nr:DNA polymerase III subunit gamma/tau [Candidatus Paceibacterota bacterium]